MTLFVPKINNHKEAYKEAEKEKPAPTPGI